MPFTLEDAVRSPVVCPAFRKLCLSELEPENIDFILLVRDITKLGAIGFNPGFPAGTAANDRANYIYHHFINPPGSGGAAVSESKDVQSAQVNVGDHIVTFLTEKLAQKKLEPDSFLEPVPHPTGGAKFSAYGEIWSLLELNAWTRFQASQDGKELLTKEEARIKALPPPKKVLGRYWGNQMLPEPLNSTPLHHFREKKSDKKL